MLFTDEIIINSYRINGCSVPGRESRTNPVSAAFRLIALLLCVTSTPPYINEIKNVLAPSAWTELVFITFLCHLQKKGRS